MLRDAHRDPEASFQDRLSRKEDGRALCSYRPYFGTLYVICGTGRCNEYTATEGLSLFDDHVQVFEKKVRGDMVQGYDTFAGFMILGGADKLERNAVKAMIGEDYDEYSVHHNLWRIVRPVAEIFEQAARESTEPPSSLQIYWKNRIRRALRDQDPRVHIPLIEW